MFVAQERREAILAFAERKFGVPEGCKDEDQLLSVFKAMAAIDGQSQQFHLHLSP